MSTWLLVEQRVNGGRNNVGPSQKPVVPLSSGYDFNELNFPPYNRSTVPMDPELRARGKCMTGDRYGVVVQIRRSCYRHYVEPALVVARDSLNLLGLRHGCTGDVNVKFNSQF
jgi:hypothetical protein